jgi:hypothetical protein
MVPRPLHFGQRLTFSSLATIVAALTPRFNLPTQLSFFAIDPRNA